MPIRPISTIYHTLTPSSGSAWETLYVKQCVIRQIIVSSATSSTVFDISIENSHGDEVFRVNDVTSDIIEDVNIYFAKAGTIKILNATLDEVFTYTVTIEE